MRKKIIAIVISLSIFLQLGGCLKDNKYINKNPEIFLYKLLKQIDDIEVEYNFNYKDDFDYLFIKKQENKIKQCKTKFSDDYNYFDVYSNILENSGLELNKRDLDEKEELVQKALLEALIDIYVDKDSVNDDYCLLQNTKIKIDKIKEEEVLAKYSYYENLITIDYDKIKVDYDTNMYSSTKEVLSFFDRLTQIIRHEVNHARQKACNCRIDAGQICSGIGYNELFVNNLTEASAESETYSKEVNEFSGGYTLNEVHSYPNERKNQALLLMMAMFKPGFEIENYYDAIFSSDLKEFHKIFNLKSKEDYETFYRIYMALNLLDEKCTLKDVDGDYKEFVGNDYKIDIFKIVTKDLIIKINDEDLELTDSLNLYSIIKSVILFNERVVTTNVEEIKNREYLYDKEFLEKIGIINNVFYSFVCNKYEISQVELENIIFDYSFVNDSNFIFYYHEGGISQSEEEITKIEEFVNKFPMIKELLFCYNGVWYFDNEIFDNEYRLLRENKE